MEEQKTEGASTSDSTDILPESMLSLAPQDKINILLALMDQVRTSLRYWTQQSYTVIVWSIGVMVTISGFWILKESKTNAIQRVLLIAIVVFGCVTQYYLLLLRRAFSSDGRALTRIEAGLRLYEHEAYLKGQPLLKFRRGQVEPRQAKHLALIHAIVVVLTGLVVVFVK